FFRTAVQAINSGRRRLSEEIPAKPFAGDKLMPMQDPACSPSQPIDRFPFHFQVALFPCLEASVHLHNWIPTAGEMRGGGGGQVTRLSITINDVNLVVLQ